MYKIIEILEILTTKDFIRNSIFLVIAIAVAVGALNWLKEDVNSRQEKIKREQLSNYNNGRCIRCNSEYIPLSYDSKDGVYYLCTNLDCRFGTCYKKD